jgi:hypothetical protein
MGGFVRVSRKGLDSMNWTNAGTCAMLALASCTTAQKHQALTAERLEAAKQACGAADAYIFEAEGQRAISFRGVATDFNARQAQAVCLKHELKGTDVQFVGFLSEPPRR